MPIDFGFRASETESVYILNIAGWEWDEGYRNSGSIEPDYSVLTQTPTAASSH